jgi:phosphate:Na+ symporter
VPERLRDSRRARIAAIWIITALLVAVYLALPSGDDGAAQDASPAGPDAAGEPHKLEIVSVSPAETPPGTTVIIRHRGADETAPLRALVAKLELEVVARQPGTLVARLPADVAHGRAKLRIADDNQRSKPYDLRIKARNWRKPFRGLVGGLALLAVGIAVLARGVRETVGLGGARRLASFARSAPAALGFGTVVGAVTQSTTAAAGLLAGLVTSSVIAVGPAAVAFLGAQLGAATAPLMITEVLDPREGLLAIAIGALWLGLAADRRASALGRFVLGAGLIAFGLHVLRPAFEPLVADTTLIPFVDHLRADSVRGLVSCALLGAALVAAFQGPAPVVVLVLGLAQTTGHLDLRTALAILTGSGLGAAVGALLTAPAGARPRRLVQLHLVLGTASTLLALATVPIWSALADRLVAGSPHDIDWGKRVLLPNMSKHLGAAFALSQLATAVVLVPLIPMLVRALARLRPEAASTTLAYVGDPARLVRERLLRAARAQRQALASLQELALHGQRTPGRMAEHALADARAALEEALPICAGAGDRTLQARTAFGMLQMQRSLESLLREAERLTDRRVATTAGASTLPPLPSQEAAIVVAMHALLAQGADAVGARLEGRQAIDLEAARAREIEMNGQEARARDALLAASTRRDGSLTSEIGVLELVDAYESAGNHLYRVASALEEGDPDVAIAAVQPAG